MSLSVSELSSHIRYHLLQQKDMVSQNKIFFKLFIFNPINFAKVSVNVKIYFDNPFNLVWFNTTSVSLASPINRNKGSRLWCRDFACLTIIFLNFFSSALVTCVLFHFGPLPPSSPSSLIGSLWVSGFLLEGLPSHSAPSNLSFPVWDIPWWCGPILHIANSEWVFHSSLWKALLRKPLDP